MDKKSFEKYIEKMFTYNLLPNLMDFIRIPNLSPAYDYNWNTNGLLLKAANLIISYAKSLDIKNSNIIFKKNYKKFFNGNAFSLNLNNKTIPNCEIPKFDINIKKLYKYMSIFKCL